MGDLKQELLQDLKWRCIGPPRGGRVVAVSGHPSEKMVFYFGAVAGGVWKTEDGGTYWENISDGYFNTASIGALTVAEADPNVLYAGTGETTIRTDVSYGDGVYKSTDGGKSWRHMGLAETRHIGEIRVDPRDPDRVYVAALGHAFGPNDERGVFRSQDGGKNWQRVLYCGDKAGAVDLALDPNNPRVLFAAVWEAYRNFWSLSSGGPKSGLYRSEDGGDSWVEVSANKGFPSGIKGKIGVSVAPAQKGRIWAIVEAEDAGLYRSEDGGDSWQLASAHRDLLHRPWYYCHVFADPQHADTAYITNLKMWKTSDGGSNFTEITTPHGDNHDLWMDPADPQRMVQGNDGGACVSFNGGQSWSTIYNQLTAQFYRLDIDNQFPYRVYATQQDNSSVSVPSATEYGAITWGDCYPAGTGESGFVAVHPEDANIVYIGAVGSSPGGSGVLQRYDHRTRQIRLVNVWPEEYFGWAPKDLKYRFAWTFPIAFSPHDAGTLYVGGNRLFRSRDEGHSWEPISPDLTRADPDTLQVSGGPLTKDASGAEHYGTLSAFVESPQQAGVFWAASDDGLVHLSRDGGARWDNVTPADLPEWSYIGSVEVSASHAGTAYIAATRYKLDDYQPYLYKTEDWGQTWQGLGGNFPAGEISRVLRADPVAAGLLWVGTETGLFVSFDDGAHWQRLRNNLPVVPIYDLKVKDADLVVATHGRSFWLLDDITPLRQLAQGVPQEALLVPPQPSYRRWINWFAKMPRGEGKNYMLGLGNAATFYERPNQTGGYEREFLDAGINPPAGAIVYYWLGEVPSEGLRLNFLDADGELIKAFDSTASETDGQALAPAQKGLNRFVWDMRYPEAVEVDKSLEEAKYAPFGPERKGANGPLAPPGTYQVQLECGDYSCTHTFEVCADPRVEVRAEDFAAQFGLWIEIRDKLSMINEALNRSRRLRRQVETWLQRLEGSEGVQGAEGMLSAGRELVQHLEDIESQLTQTERETPSDSLRFPARLDARLGGLTSVVGGADGPPPLQARQLFAELSVQVDGVVERLQQVVDTEVAAFNDLIEQAGLTALEA